MRKGVNKSSSSSLGIEKNEFNLLTMGTSGDIDKVFSQNRNMDHERTRAINEIDSHPAVLTNFDKQEYEKRCSQIL